MSTKCFVKTNFIVDVAHAFQRKSGNHIHYNSSKDAPMVTKRHGTRHTPMIKKGSVQDKKPGRRQKDRTPENMKCLELP
jgi:hypothetical protein